MKSLKEEVLQADTIAIYGAGHIANIIYYYLKEMDCQEKIYCFIVSQKENNPSELYGIKVVELTEVVHKLSDKYVIIATGGKAQPEISANLKANGILNFDCIDEKELWSDYYALLHELPIANNKLLFSNMLKNGYGGNPKYIAEKLLELDEKRELDIVWVVEDEHYELPGRIRKVKNNSAEYYHELATARIWIDNARKNRWVRKREGQYYIQTWHGAAPMKRVEADVMHSLSTNYILSAQNDSQMADLFLSGSKFYSELYKRSFWYDGPIMEVGLPRQDIFWKIDEIRNKVRKFYNIPNEKKIVLYAPTFRNKFLPQVYDLDLKMVVEALEGRFQSEFIVMVSKHPMNQRYEYEYLKQDSYIDVCQYADFEELLAAADVLISDYSGCVYDYSFTKRPVFLFQNDYEDYLVERDFYIPMEKLPYIRAYTNEELVEKIRTFQEDAYIEALDRFMESMGNFDDGTASEKVAKHILERIYS